MLLRQSNVTEITALSVCFFFSEANGLRTSSMLRARRSNERARQRKSKRFRENEGK